MSTLAALLRETRTRQAGAGVRIRLRRAMALACLLMLLAAGTLWLAVRGRLPGTTDVVAVAKFAASPQFAALPPEQQQPYVNAMTEHRWQLAAAFAAGQLTQAEVDAAFRNTWNVATAQHMEEYGALTTPAERRAYLDRIIDEQEKYRLFKRAAGAPLRPEPGAPKGSSPWTAPTRLKKLIETMPPAHRSRLSEFHADLRKRRLERGLGR